MIDSSAHDSIEEQSAELDEVLKDFVTAQEVACSQEVPSAECVQRSREAGLAAFDLLKMRQLVPSIPLPAGSLADYFRDLAAAAGADLARILEVTGIQGPAEAPDPATSGLWARLCWQVGIPFQLAIDRLRTGFAKSFSNPQQLEWLQSSVPALAHWQSGSPPATRSLENILRDHETHYSTQQRSVMRKALLAFQETYEDLSCTFPTNQEE